MRRRTARRTTRATMIGVLLAAGSLVLSGCGMLRGGGDSGAAATTGVTEDPCPSAVNPDNGCIYLGIISDLTVGPFRALAVPITDAQKAFWRRVNQQGGIGGYDIDVTTFIRDNKYNPQVHNQVYQEIKGEVLALAQTLGSPTTAAIINDMKADKIVAAPASWTSAWAFEDVILESGANYCIETMNAVDYAVEEFNADSVMAVHYAGDYGADAAGGAKFAAEQQGLSFSAVETPQGQDNQGRAIDAIVSENPDLVIITTGPTDASVVIGQAAARGFQGRFIGTSPTWNEGLLESPAAPAIKAQYLQSAPWEPFQTDSPGHAAMREALPGVDPNDGYTSGWVWSYPLKAVLEQAAENGDLSRDGVLRAVKQVESVDYEGMLPTGAGNFAGDPNSATFRQTLITQPDETALTGTRVVRDLFTGPTAQSYNLEQPCFETL